MFRITHVKVNEDGFKGIFKDVIDKLMKKKLKESRYKRGEEEKGNKQSKNNFLIICVSTLNKIHKML